MKTIEYPLTDSYAAQSDGSTVSIQLLSETDADTIQMLGVFEDMVYISIENQSVLDFANNSVSAVSNISGTIVEDNSPPSLVRFVLDLDNGILQASFNEIINVSNIGFSAIEILSSPGSPTSVPLTGGNVMPPNGREFNITLLQADLDAIKNISDLAVSNESTYLTIFIFHCFC